MTAVLPARTESPERAGPSVESLIVTLGLALVFAVALRPALDYDLWWHLRTADWMLDHHRWVGVDPFSHTRPDVVRVQTDWLADLTLFGTWRLGGLAAIAVLMAALATFGTALIFRLTTGRFGIRLLTTGAVALASSVFWVSRPQMVTFVLTAVVLGAVTRWRREAVDAGPGPAWLWCLVPLVALWSNLHGGVVYGVLLIGAMTAGEWVNVLAARVLPRRLVISRRLSVPALRRLTLVTIASVAAMSVNPSFTRIYGLPFHQVSSAARFVDEVQPPALGDPWVWPFFALLAVTVLLLAWSWRRFDAVELLPVLGAAALALQFSRSIPFLATVAAPVVARRGSDWWTARRGLPVAVAVTPSEHRRLLMVTALVIVMVAAVVPFRLAESRVAPARAALFPEGAAQWLVENDPPENLFNEFNWGGYLLLHAPEYRVSIDGRTDVYDEYLDVAIATAAGRPGWAAELDREGIGTVLISNRAGLAGELADDVRWQVAYRDAQATVFVRR